MITKIDVFLEKNDVPSEDQKYVMFQIKKRFPEISVAFFLSSSPQAKTLNVVATPTTILYNKEGPLIPVLGNRSFEYMVETITENS